MSSLQSIKHLKHLGLLGCKQGSWGLMSRSVLELWRHSPTAAQRSDLTASQQVHYTEISLVFESNIAKDQC